MTVSLLDRPTTVQQYVDLEDIVLTEFSLTKHIGQLRCHLAPGASNYDMIIGRKTMKQLGMVIDFDTASVHWKEHSFPMKLPISRPRLSLIHI